MHQEENVDSSVLTEKKYSVPQAAELLGLAPKTLWTKVGNRQISVYRIGRCVRVGEREIMRLLNEGFMPARDAA
jgi:excisionase family DNA binding protein